MRTALPGELPPWRRGRADGRPAVTSEAASLLGQLADRDRLTVFAAVVLGDRTVDQLVATTRLTGRVVARALARLQSAGLVEETDGAWTARLETLQEATRAGAAQG